MAATRAMAVAAAVALGSAGRSSATPPAWEDLAPPAPCKARICRPVVPQSGLARILDQLANEQAGDVRAAAPLHFRTKPVSSEQLTALISSCAPGSPATLIRSLVLTESGGYALRIATNGASRRVFSPADPNEAVATLAALSRQGATFNIGLMQLNSATLRRLNLPLTAALDPCRNLAIGAQIFDHAYAAAFARSAPTSPLWSASSIYNTGDPLRGLRNGYAARVQAVLQTSARAAG